MQNRLLSADTGPLTFHPLRDRERVRWPSAEDRDWTCSTSRMSQFYDGCSFGGGSMSDSLQRRVPAFCPLCVSRCGCEAVVEDGRLVAIEPDPLHPTGKALCAKGRASTALVDATDRLLYPMRRTRPKGDPDAGWRRITWDEALNETATAMRRIAAESGPEAVAFAVTTPSGTAISDAAPWIDRLINAFGSPNNCNATELCAWHRNYARDFTT